MKRGAAIIVLFVVAIFWVACDSSSERQMEQALLLAGENRGEMEKVLNHYAHHPDKLEAAKFLIRNMPGKYALTGKVVDEFHHFIDSMYQIEQEAYDEESINQLYRAKSVYRNIPGKPLTDLIGKYHKVQSIGCETIREGKRRGFSHMKKENRYGGDK